VAGSDPAAAREQPHAILPHLARQVNAFSSFSYVFLRFPFYILDIHGEYSIMRWNVLVCPGQTGAQGDVVGQGKGERTVDNPVNILCLIGGWVLGQLTYLAWLWIQDRRLVKCSMGVRLRRIAERLRMVKPRPRPKDDIVSFLQVSGKNYPVVNPWFKKKD
jgi:hypothetical protein